MQRLQSTRRSAVFLAFLLASACAQQPKANPEDTIVWGYVQLVPKRGAEHVSEGSYGDRRLQKVNRFDYSRPEMSVVYDASSIATRVEPFELRIEPHPHGARLIPDQASANPIAGIRVINLTPATQVVSLPTANRVIRIPSGESATFGSLTSGDSILHLLGKNVHSRQRSTRVFVHPGVTAAVDLSGRYVLRGLEPGTRRLRAWHPRLPQSPVQTVDVDRGEVVRVDIEIGVDEGRKEQEMTQ